MKNNQKYSFRFLFFISMALSQVSSLDSLDKKLVIITATDGTEIVGAIQKETDNIYIIKSIAGLITEVPKNSIIKISGFKGKIVDGKIFFPDPNKSMYLFAPSAFPIGNNRSYCRDFCLFFPSYNYGLTNNISLQGGAFVFPGSDISITPLVFSGKISSNAQIMGLSNTALGMMYVRFPDIEDESSSSSSSSSSQSISSGGGFVFATATIGNRFSHVSTSLGWGFFQINNSWSFSGEPLLVIAGNYRISNPIALVFEWWRFPGSDLSNAPIMVSGRFIGRKIAVDLGLLTTLNTNGFGVPLLNFTYHIN